MAEGRSREAWDHTAALWAPLANWLRDSDARPQPFTPADIHPYLRRERGPAPKPRKVPLMAVLDALFPVRK